MVPLEYLHLGMGLCTDHQEQFNNNYEIIYKGRQRHFTTPADLWEKATKYFEECERLKEPLTTSGMAIAIGTSWGSFLRYRAGHHGPVFSQVAWEISQIIERFAEKNLYGEHKQGARFHLMARFGYAERTETVSAGGGSAAPHIYLPHNGRDQVKDLASDPAKRETEAAVVGDQPSSTKSSAQQSPLVEGDKPVT
jgi:hypothetical protein